MAAPHDDTTHHDAHEVIVSREGPVLVMTLNRPERKNAVNKALATQLGAALDEFEADPGLAVGVILGAGGSFCAGMDLAAFLAGESPNVPGQGFAGITERALTKPLIAGVEGYAVGGGFEVALCCDLIVAADGAKFGLPEVKRGLIAGAGGLLRLPERIPYSFAAELALTGELMSATDAHSHGLVNRVVEGSVREAALDLAAKVARNAPLALAATKQVLGAGVDPDRFAFQREQFTRVAASADAAEGARAFKERRDPQWVGS